ncbi:hypothetical protein JGK46_003684 [Aeromonas bestiarum]|nr:hypothetical protein [Aeromonas bestiarum]
MPELAISDFSNIAVATGTPKKTKLKNLAQRSDYAHYKDYYLQLRTAIKSLYNQKRHVSYLIDVSRKQKDSSKKIKFERLSQCFIAWQSGKRIEVYTSLREAYVFNNTTIHCNPELSVVINGIKTHVKLYFNESQKMTKERADYICYLMSEAILDTEAEYIVLDLHTGREFRLMSERDKMEEKVFQEITWIEQNWPE